MRKITALILIFASLTMMVSANEISKRNDMAQPRGQPEVSQIVEAFYLPTSGTLSTQLQNLPNYLVVSLLTENVLSITEGDRKVRDVDSQNGTTKTYNNIKIALINKNTGNRKVRDVDLCSRNSLYNYNKQQDPLTKVTDKITRLPRGAIRQDSILS